MFSKKNGSRLSIFKRTACHAHNIFLRADRHARQDGGQNRRQNESFSYPGFTFRFLFL
jgi:hypothetical protein